MKTFKHMKTLYNIIVALVFTFSMALSAQNTIADFTISSTSTDGLNITSTFVKSGNTLSWTQQNGDNSLVNTFTIDSIQGNWDETDNIGNLSINLSLNGYQVILTLNGDSNGRSATLELINDNPNTENQLLNLAINAMTYN